MNDKTKACQKYVELRAAGENVKTATAAAERIAKVGHSLLDLSWYAANGTTPELPPVKPEDRHACMVALRGGAGWNGQFVGQQLSWGRISIAMGLFNPKAPSTAGENAVQREFVLATKAVGGEAIAAEGTRSGRGGRYLDGDARLYQGGHKRAGVELEKPRQADREQVMAEAPTYTSKVVAFASGKKAAAKRTRKPRTPKAAAPKAIEAAKE